MTRFRISVHIIRARLLTPGKAVTTAPHARLRRSRRSTRRAPPGDRNRCERRRRGRGERAHHVQEVLANPSTEDFEIAGVVKE